MLARTTVRLPQGQIVSASKDGKRLVMVPCLDNLLRGAAGQAVRNMNLVFGFGGVDGFLRIRRTP